VSSPSCHGLECLPLSWRWGRGTQRKAKRILETRSLFPRGDRVASSDGSFESRSKESGQCPQLNEAPYVCPKVQAVRCPYLTLTLCGLMTNHFESIRAFRLYEKTSKNGNTYLVGRWGGAKVAVLKSRDAADDGSAIWDVLLSPAPDRAKPDVRSPAECVPKIASRTADDRASALSSIGDEIPF